MKGFLSTSCEMRCYRQTTMGNKQGGNKEIKGVFQGRLIHPGPTFPPQLLPPSPPPQIFSLPYAPLLSGLTILIWGQMNQNWNPAQFFTICSLTMRLLNLPSLSCLILQSLMLSCIHGVIKTHPTVTAIHLACFCIHLFIHF